MKACGGASPPPPSQVNFISEPEALGPLLHTVQRCQPGTFEPSNTLSYRGPATPGPPAIYPSKPSNPFYRHSNGVLFAYHYFHKWNLNCADLERAQVDRAEVVRAEVECADLCRTR